MCEACDTTETNETSDKTRAFRTVVFEGHSEEVLSNLIKELLDRYGPDVVASETEPVSISAISTTHVISQVDYALELLEAETDSLSTLEGIVYILNSITLEDSQKILEEYEVPVPGKEYPEGLPWESKANKTKEIKPNLDQHHVKFGGEDT
jgi:hypothetical protein